MTFVRRHQEVSLRGKARASTRGWVRLSTNSTGPVFYRATRSPMENRKQIGSSLFFLDFEFPHDVPEFVGTRPCIFFFPQSPPPPASTPLIFFWAGRLPIMF